MVPGVSVFKTLDARRHSVAYVCLCLPFDLVGRSDGF